MKNRIIDEFTDLKVSRQRKHQLRKAKSSKELGIPTRSKDMPGFKKFSF